MSDKKDANNIPNHDEEFENNKSGGFSLERFKAKADRAFEAFLRCVDGSSEENAAIPDDEAPAVKDKAAEKQPAFDWDAGVFEDEKVTVTESQPTEPEFAAAPAVSEEAEAAVEQPEASEEQAVSSEENTQVISDEELAKLLGVEVSALRGETELPEKRYEETLVFKDGLTDDDVKVFGGESLTEEDVENTHVYKEPISQAEPAKSNAAEEPGEERFDEDEDEYEARDFRPIRRRRAYRTGCMGGVMYFIMVVCISVILASLAWQAANDVLSLNKEPVTAEVTVREGFTVDQVATDLKAAGIIEYPSLFKLFLGFGDGEKSFDPGTYTLSSSLDYRAIVTNLRQERNVWEDVDVTIPEGKTLLQTFQILEENKVSTVEELLEAAKNYEFNFDFLNPDRMGDENRLEGFLFPDTYTFYVDSDPSAAIRKFLNNYENRITNEMVTMAAQRGYTMDEILVIASMIEMEAASDSERPIIASVIYNRLNSSDFPCLQIDATVQYALGERKEKLSNDDLQVDSPYNTYLYEGLPPGPIANPGMASIRAALNPEGTNYYFYALNKDGAHEFFSSYSAFENFVNSADYGG